MSELLMSRKLGAECEHNGICELRECSGNAV